MFGCFLVVGWVGGWGLFFLVWFGLVVSFLVVVSLIVVVAAVGVVVWRVCDSWNS